METTTMGFIGYRIWGIWGSYYGFMVEGLDFKISAQWTAADSWAGSGSWCLSR